MHVLPLVLVMLTQLHPDKGGINAASALCSCCVYESGPLLRQCFPFIFLSVAAKNGIIRDLKKQGRTAM
jgi:hypothetical protein